jgi:hypothetical protein
MKTFLIKEGPGGWKRKERGARPGAGREKNQNY